MSPLKSFSFLFFSCPYCTLWRQVTLLSPRVRSEELCSISLRQSIRTNYLEFFKHRKFVYSLPFVLFFKTMYLCQYGLKDIYFISFLNNIILLYFVVQISLVLAIDSFHLVPVSLWHTPIIVGFHWALPHFLALQDAPGSSCVFVAPVLESAIFPKNLWFLLLQKDIRHQDLGAGFACCSWMLLRLCPLNYRGRKCMITY